MGSQTLPLNQFATFYASLMKDFPDNDQRGKAFEKFTKWFLQHDPYWSTKVDKVWLWNEYPKRWGPDCGIDLVIQQKDGKHWAVQAKCYAPEYDISKNDVDKFLSESNRSEIHGRLLMASTDGIGAKARQVCDNQDKPVVRFMLSNFEESQLDYPSNFVGLPKAHKRAKPTPKPHQNDAISDVVTGFISSDRGQLIKACGTGKTFTTLWIKEALQSQLTLVTVPSLGLLSQMLHSWAFAANIPFESLCVCSDKTVGTESDNDAIKSITELPFPVTSDSNQVEIFLKGKGPRVVFSTYQSSPIIGAAQANPTTPAFDLIVADEAHRCSGVIGSDFTTILNNTKIRGAKRLFATATPRTYSNNIKSAATERGVEVADMNDESIFGPVFHALPFNKAIEKKLLTDYQVVVVGVDNPMIAEYITKRELVTNGSTVETDSASLAAQIGLLKAIKDYDLKRVISFHSRTSSAKSFTTDIKKALNLIAPENRPSGQLITDVVTGDISAYKRKIKLNQLKTLSDNEREILGNVRCLSEGVDLPELDGVAFIDPKGSPTDIIQAVGRAIRLSKNKTIGTIILPVFIEDGQNAEDRISASNFKSVWDVLNALKAHDDVLSDQLSEMRTGLGKVPNSQIAVESLNKLKIKLDLPTSINSDFSSALSTRIVEQTTASWDFMYGLTENFIEVNGHCFIPGNEIMCGYRIGSWIGMQRYLKDSMSKERKNRLDKLPGWVWGHRESKWEQGFKCVLDFIKKNGHARISQDYKSDDDHRTGLWVSVQRKAKDSMPLERKNRLEAIKEWSWDAIEDKWSECFLLVKNSVEKNGNSNGPFGRASDGRSVQEWINKQRSDKNIISLEKKILLDGLPGWSWHPLSDRWEQNFNFVKIFVDQTGEFPGVSEKEILTWLQRQRKIKDGLPLEYKIRLESLPGWSWEPLEDKWQVGFAYLKSFFTINGHLNIPNLYKNDDGYPLGEWIRSQRKIKVSITKDHKDLLESVPGWSWNVIDDKWVKRFESVEKFIIINGHSKIPKGYRDENICIGKWVIEQRGRTDLTLEQKNKLESLPGWSWDPLAEQWEEGYRYLQSFLSKNGHLNISAKFLDEDGYPLGQWVCRQRRKVDRMSEERKTRLESVLGWVWDGQQKPLECFNKLKDNEAEKNLKIKSVKKSKVQR